MANYKVAYGKKGNIDLAIERGIIPPGSIILTEDTNEMFFYDLTRNFSAYEQKYRFESMEEAEEWIKDYDGCQGQIFSIHEGDTCNIYTVGYDNKLHKVNNTSESEDKVFSDKDPTEYDIDYKLLTYWINVLTEEVFLLVSIKEDKASWKSITSTSTSTSTIVDSHYKFTQSTASASWFISHKMGKYPSVSVVDSARNLVAGEIKYIDKDSLVVQFQSPFSGKAYLN